MFGVKMAKSLLKKAKKATKSVKKKVKSASSSVKSNAGNVRAHIEKLAGERRDCATIHNLLKDTAKYKSDEDIIALIKAKGYETLLGEVS
jgi:hypothetical protein